MKSSRPVDGDVAFAPVESSSSLHTATSADAAEIEQAIEDWAIVTNIVFALFLGEVIHVVRSNFLQEIDVLVGVKLGHFMPGGRFCALQKEVSKL